MGKYSILKFGLALIVALPLNMTAQAMKQRADSKLLNAVEYASLLDSIQSDLVTWEKVINNIEPRKGDVSYKVGSDIAQNRELALLEIRNTRSFIAQERTRHTIYRELALGGFLNDLNAGFYQLALSGALNDVSVATNASYGKEIGSVQVQLMNDGMHRLKLLESGTCP